MADSSTTAAGPSQATSDERTPLLSPDDRAEERTTDNPNDDTHIEDEEAVAGAAWSGSRPKFLYGLVITSLVASILLLIDFVVIAIAASNQPQLFHMPYGLVGNFKGFTAFVSLPPFPHILVPSADWTKGVLAAVSSLVSVLRLRRGRPDHWATVNFFTVLVDLFLVFGLAALVEPGIEELSAWYPSRRCATYFGHPPDPGAVEECERFAKKILVALWGFVLLGAIVA